MLKEFQDAVDTVFKVLEDGGSSPESFEVALREVERNATKIDEESRRRNMVVT
jgi:flavin-binding protein dodecin